MLVHHTFGIVTCILLAPLLAGCRPSYKLEVAPVSGTVRCNGNLVKEGNVLFTPIPPDDANRAASGKSAYGVIRPDGTYILTTYDKEDGALIGQHHVRVYKPDPEDDEQIVVDPFVCGDTVLLVEVKPGENVLDLNLSN
jgi:hypothetical protein